MIHPPVIGLWGRRLLVAQEPPMAIRSMDDIDVAPIEMARRWGDRNTGVRPSHMFVSVIIPAGSDHRGRKKGRDKSL